MKYVKLFENFINEAKFSKWVKPDRKTLELEFKVEHTLKGQSFFDSVDEFLQKAKEANLVEIDSNTDAKISYRSRTQSYQDLVNLLKTYRSWGKYRSEDKLKDMYYRIENGQEMDAPIVLRWPNGNMRVFSGNTRMDVAFQLGINPKVLMIDLD